VRRDAGADGRDDRDEPGQPPPPDERHTEKEDDERVHERALQYAEVTGDEPRDLRHEEAPQPGDDRRPPREPGRRTADGLERRRERLSCRPAHRRREKTQDENHDQYLGGHAERREQ